MLDSLYIGATGMQAQQANLDVIANNMANVNTTGFKRNRIDFEDLGTGCAEQLLRRLNPSHPTRRLLLVIFHDIFPGYLKTDFVRKDSLQRNPS